MSSLGPGGMPRPRRQQFDDMLIPEESIIQKRHSHHPSSQQQQQPAPPLQQSQQPRYYPNYPNQYYMPQYVQPQPIHYRSSYSGYPSPQHPGTPRMPSSSSSLSHRNSIQSSKTGFFSNKKKSSKSKESENLDNEEEEEDAAIGSAQNDDIADALPSTDIPPQEESENSSVNEISGVKQNQEKATPVSSQSDGTSVSPNLISGRTMSLMSPNLDHSLAMQNYPHASERQRRSSSTRNAHPQSGRSSPMMAPQDIQMMRNRSGSALGYQQYPQQHLPVDPHSGRAMSMGHYPRSGPPPPPHIINRPPSSRMSYHGMAPGHPPSQPMMMMMPPPHHPGAMPMMYPHRMPPPSNGYQIRSRSSSKSSSPSSSTMSRPGSSQTIPTSSTPDSEKQQSSVVTTDRAISPVPISSENSVSRSVSLVPCEVRAQCSSPIMFQHGDSASSTETSSFEEETSAETDSSMTSVDSDKYVSIGEMNEVKRKNGELLDEIRLVTSELADSIRRELNVDERSDDDSDTQVETDEPGTDSEGLYMKHDERVALIVKLQQELGLERRKRLALEEELAHTKHNIDVKHLYDSVDMEARAMDAERKLQNIILEKEDLVENIRKLKSQVNTPSASAILINRKHPESHNLKLVHESKN